MSCDGSFVREVDMRTAGPLFPLLGSLFYLIGTGPAGAGDIVFHQSGAGSAASYLHDRSFDVALRAGAQPADRAPLVHGQPAVAPSSSQAVTLNLSQALDERWTLLASAGWQERSGLRQPRGAEADHPLYAANGRNYRDTWHLAVGTQYRATPELLWQAGVAYDSPAIADRERAFAMPTSATWRLAAGLSYAIDKAADLNFNYSYVRLGDMPAEQGRRDAGIGDSGEFSNAGVHVVSFSLIWRY